MPRILFVLIILFYSFSGFTQTFEWVKTPVTSITLNPVNLGYSTVVDPFGDIYLGGYKDAPVLYGQLFGQLLYNKYNQGGDLLFSKTFHGAAVLNQMISDSEGNILLAVEHLDSIIIDNVVLLNPTPFPQHVFLKMSPEGNLLFHKVLFIPEVNVSDFQSIAVDKFDNIYLGYDNYGDSYIQKLSPTGLEISLIIQSSVNRITSVSVDSEGNIYSTGSCANFNSTYAGVPQPTELLYNIYLVKYSPEGIFQWIKYVEDITCPAPKVKVKNPNEIYFSSSIFDGTMLDDLIVIGPTSGGSDFFIAKLNADGNYLWAREVPGNGSVEPGNKDYLSLDDQGNVYLCGTFSGGLTDWGNGIITNTHTFGNYDAIILKYNPDGVIQLAITAGGMLNDNASNMSIDADGAIYLSGLVRGNATFGSISHTQESAFDFTAFLTKINDQSQAVQDHTYSNIHVYPNPTLDIVNIESSEKLINISLYSMFGQKIQSGFYNNQLDMSDLVSGVYVLLVKTDKGIQSTKLIKK